MPALLYDEVIAKAFARNQTQTKGYKMDLELVGIVEKDGQIYGTVFTGKNWIEFCAGASKNPDRFGLDFVEVDFLDALIDYEELEQGIAMLVADHYNNKNK